MLNTFYDTLFKPGEVPLSASISVTIGCLTLLVLTLNAAGAIHAGLVGFIFLLLLFLVAGLLGCYWLATSMHFCAQLLGGQGTSGQTLQATLRGLWPLLLSGAAVSLSNLSASLGSIFTLSLMMGTLLTVAGSVRQAHQLNWGTAMVTLVLTLGCSGLALLGLILWPLMLIAGL